MKDYEHSMSFGEDVAEAYDDAPRGDEDAAVAFLKGLTKDGPALELAVGTGRIALPLAARGVRVEGVDLSPAMIRRMRSKPGGDRIPVTTGDFADVPVKGNYRLIYVVFNTLFNLHSQEDQVRCFENVAAHLTEGGSFVIEAFHPGYLYRLRDSQYVDAELVEVGKVGLDVARHDPAKQLLEKNHVSLSVEGVRLNPIVLRYAWPAELDLMARIAGLRLKERWDGWDRRPFTADSRVVVSVYGR